MERNPVPAVEVVVEVVVEAGHTLRIVENSEVSRIDEARTEGCRQWAPPCLSQHMKAGIHAADFCVCSKA